LSFDRLIHRAGSHPCWLTPASSPKLAPDADVETKPGRQGLLARWRQFINSDKAYQYMTYIAVFLLLNAVALGFGVTRLFADRDKFYEQRDVLPLRDISQWQRQTQLIIRRLERDDAPAKIGEIQLHVALAQSRIGLIRVEDLNFLPPTLAQKIHAANKMWFAMMEQLNDWYDNSRDPVARQALVNGLTNMERIMNDALTEITVQGLDLNTKAREANSRLLLVIGFVAASLILAVILIATILVRTTRKQLEATVEKDSIRKSPDQSPFPIMRFNSRHEVIYSNPASRLLESIFGIKDNMMTEPKYKDWLEGAFKTGAQTHIDGEHLGRTYSIMSSPVEGEEAVNIYAFDVSELKAAEVNIRRQLSRLNALRTIDKAIASSSTLQETLNEVLTQTRDHLGVDAAAIFVTYPGDERLYSAAFQGFITSEIANFSLMPGESLAGRVAKDRKILSLPDLIKSGIPVAPELNNIEGFKSYFAGPLEVRGELLGVLEAFQRRVFNPDDEWLEFFNTLAGQAAIALDNAQLFEGLRVSNSELRQAYDTTLEGWAKALELRDKETEGHSRRVTELTMLMAKEFGVPESQWDHVRRGAILHDIGKMGTPDEILLKPGPLSQAEWEIMKRHTTHAYELLSPIRYLEGALDIPWAHHEKWDGTGYPRKLKGEEIPVAARIFAIIDVWDALRSDRPYRPAWPKEKTVSYLKENAGIHF
jgi:putative nucleotidyltransferase with HDIG domain